jgi:hypothetical protein
VPATAFAQLGAALSLESKRLANNAAPLARGLQDQQTAGAQHASDFGHGGAEIEKVMGRLLARIKICIGERMSHIRPPAPGRSCLPLLHGRAA